MDEAEPLGVLWDGFRNCSRLRTVLRRLRFGLVVVAAVLVFVLLYLPYAIYWGGLIPVPGVEPSTLQDLSIGLLISVGNCIVAALADLAAESAAFTRVDSRNAAVAIITVSATLLNTVADLAITQWIVSGNRLSVTFEDQDTPYDVMLAQALFSLIVPGYLLMPVVIAPFAERALYLPAKAVVAARRVRRRAAEEALMMPQFDIKTRMADCTNNFTIMMTLAVVASPYGWQASAALVANVVLMSLIDRVLLLRQSQNTPYVTGQLSKVFGMMLGVPAAAISAICAWWAYQSQYLPLYCVLIAPLCHAVVYGLAQATLARWATKRRMASRSEDYQTAYTQLVAERNPWTYCNTNPVFCLRSRAEQLGQLRSSSGWKQVLAAGHLGGEGGCTPYMKGKVYLQSAVPDVAGQDDVKAGCSVM